MPGAKGQVFICHFAAGENVELHGFPLDEFSRRVSHMVNTVAAQNHGRPVACVTLYPYFRDFGIEDEGSQCGGTAEEYRQALRDAVAACLHPSAHLVEGPKEAPWGLRSR